MCPLNPCPWARVCGGVEAPNGANLLPTWSQKDFKMKLHLLKNGSKLGPPPAVAVNPTPTERMRRAIAVNAWSDPFWCRFGWPGPFLKILRIGAKPTNVFQCLKQNINALPVPLPRQVFQRALFFAPIFVRFSSVDFGIILEPFWYRKYSKMD